VRQFHREQKRRVMERYGGAKCVICGDARLCALDLDHIHGSGNAHREVLGISGSDFYYWIEREGYPPGYQVLCANCNWKKYLAWLRSQEKVSSRAAKRAKRRRATIKTEFFTVLGGKCELCEKTDPDILRTYHPACDGLLRRANCSRGRCGEAYYKACLKDPAKLKGVTIRCRSCSRCGSEKP
jgi:hypothetical protein